jgi:pimeloyl-ACP methyl ester carboxylesterase
LQLYWESYGNGGTPLIVIHGGFGLISMMSELIDSLAAGRRIIAEELQGHGHTGDIDRPFTYEAMWRRTPTRLPSLWTKLASCNGCLTTGARKSGD